MRTRKIVKLLLSLTQPQLEEFGKYLEADFVSTDPKPRQLLEALRSKVLKAAQPANEAAILQLLWPEEAPEPGKLARLSSQLIHHCYDFLATERLKADPLAKWSLVLDQLTGQHEEEAVHITMAAVERSLRKAPPSPERLYHEYRFLETRSQLRQNQGRQNEAVPEATVRQALDAYCELAHLRLECSALNRQLALGQAAPADEAETPASRPELTELYRLVRANLLHPHDPQPLQDLHEALNTALAECRETPYKELKEIGHYALNGSIRLVNLHPGQASPRKLLAETYHHQLKAGLLLMGDRLPAYHFKNIIQNLLLLGEYQTARQHIQQYSGKLQDDYQDNSITFAQGYLAYHEKEFKIAQQYFDHLLNDYRDMYYGLDGRLMNLRILLETGEVDRLEAQSDAFRKFLTRTVMPEHHQNLYQEANRNISRLSRILYGDPEKQVSRIEKYREDITNANTVLHREWLLSKAKLPRTSR